MSLRRIPLNCPAALCRITWPTRSISRSRARRHQATYQLLCASDPANRYLVFFDETGRVAWYRRFDDIGSFGQQLANGNFGVYIGYSQGWQPDYGHYKELTPAGEIVVRHEAPDLLYTDGHELLLTPRADGYAVHLFSYSHRTVDMTPMGGVEDALIAGHQIQRFSPTGMVEFSWDAWDYFNIEDWIELPESRRQQENADFDHPNSFDPRPGRALRRLVSRPGGSHQDPFPDR